MFRLLAMALLQKMCLASGHPIVPLGPYPGKSGLPVLSISPSPYCCYVREAKLSD